MEFEDLSNEFARRYYFWRLEEARKEYELQFVRLAMMNNYHTRRTRAIIARLSKLEKSLLFPALIKSSEQKLTALTGDSLSGEEEALLEKLSLAEQETGLREEVAAQESRLKTVGKKQLKKIIKSIFLERLNPSFYSGLWFDVVLDNGWLIKTFVEVDDSSYYYSHQIYWYKTRVGPPTINLSTWFGLYPGGWVFVDDDDVERSADMIVGLCEYFIKISATLVDGLT